MKGISGGGHQDPLLGGGHQDPSWGGGGNEMFMTKQCRDVIIDFVEFRNKLFSSLQ